MRLSRSVQMIVCYNHNPIYLHSFNYRLGAVRRDLEQLKAEGLLLGSVEALSTIGYKHNFGLDRSESLLQLTAGCLAKTLETAGELRAFVFQHCYAESAVLHYQVNETDIGLRNRYFPAEVMRQLQVDHLAYLCSFATGCSGFVAVLIAAAGLFSSPDQGAAVCVMTDSMPPGVPYNMVRERILGSDHSSSFAVSRQEHGYRLLGINYYSTARSSVAFVEIVRRTVQMIHELASSIGLDLTRNNVAIHYPNIFPDTWKMVTRYLNVPAVEHVLEGMCERAHCMATDSVITLAKLHRGEQGRVHIVINYGIGLHLGVCILREERTGTESCWTSDGTELVHHG